MRTLTAIAAGVLVGGAALAGGRAMALPPAGGPGDCAVAFVDYKKAMQAHPGFKALEEKLRAEDEQLRDAVAKRKTELRKRSDDVLARVSPGTAAFESERKVLEMMGQELRYDEKAGQEAIQKRGLVGMAGFYKEVCAEAERLAREKGFACVMNVDTSPLEVEEKGQVMGGTELRLQMGIRTVIWARDDVDLTAAVVDALAKSGEGGK